MQSTPWIVFFPSKSKNARRNFVSVYGVSVPCSTKPSLRSIWVVSLSTRVPPRLIWPYPWTTEFDHAGTPAFSCGLYSVTLLTTRSMNMLPTLPTLDLRNVCEVASVSGPRPPRLLHAHPSCSPVISMMVSSPDIDSMQGGALGGGGVGDGGGLGRGAMGGGGGGDGGEGNGEGDGGEGDGGGGEGDGGEGNGGEGEGGGGNGGEGGGLGNTVGGGEGGEGGADGAGGAGPRM